MTTTPTPRYVQLADAIERRILGGEYPPGANIPSYRDLMAGAAGTEPVTSWGTVASAVALLVRRGLVEPGTNQGTRVRLHPAALQRSQGYTGPDHTSWRQAMASHGMVGDQIVRSAGREQAPPDIAIRMLLEAGTEVVVRRRIMLANGAPYQLADGYYPLDLAGGTALEWPQRMKMNAVAMLTELGRPPTQLVEEVWSRPATKAEAGDLRLRPGAPVLLILRTLSADAGPIEVARIVCAGDRMSSRYEIPL